MLTSRDAVGQRSETVRRSNLSAIVRELHLRGPLSRSDLVSHTGLTRSAIRGLIGELAAGGLVTETPNAPAGTPGRPSPLVHPVADGAVVVALEVNVDSLAAALVGFGGAVQRLVRVERPRTHVTPDAIVSDLAELAAPLVAEAEASGSLVGIGLAVAGIVRRSDGLVRMGPNLGWRDVPLGARVTGALRTGATLAAANEADLGGLAEHRRGAAVGADNVIYVMGEVGVGGNVIVDGVPLVGAAGYAGEIGHMAVNPVGTPCGCGSSGCWETEIGERAMLVRAGRSASGGPEAVDELIAAAVSGEPEARASLEHVARWLGIGLVSLINIFNPTLVVLGGVFQRVHPLIAADLDAVLDRRVPRASRELVRVVSGHLGVDAPVLGAAELAFEPMLADPAMRLAEIRGRHPALASA